MPTSPIFKNPIQRSATLLIIATLQITAPLPLNAKLPLNQTFLGTHKFQSLLQLGIRQNWKSLPIGERTARIGLALVGTPYKNFTLELHDTIESPSANFLAMDCWTFFEISLALARAFSNKNLPSPKEFLHLIELDRYRGGRCDGTFTSRLHHLEDWLFDNETRGLVSNLTPSLPGAKKIYRHMNYMGGSGSRHFRQLRANPSLIPIMARVESKLSRRGIHYIPKQFVPQTEPLLKNGDIICIVTTWPGAYTSHVGLAIRDKKGTLRFLHASRNERRVILDSRLSDYLNKYSTHAGIMVARPHDL